MLNLKPIPPATIKKGEEGYDKEKEERKKIREENSIKVREWKKRMENTKGSLLWKPKTEKERMEWKEEKKRIREEKKRREYERQEQRKRRYVYPRTKKCCCCCNVEKKR